MITIIDYGSGNIRAIGNIFERLKIPFRITDQPSELPGSAKIILPGVGAFDETITLLNESGFRKALDREVLINKIPVLGICVGMQILAEKSEEGVLDGLGWIKGEVKKIDASLLTFKPKIPHLGWNSIDCCDDIQLFENIDNERGFYFMHSYFVECRDTEDVLSTTFYGKRFPSALKHDNIYGVQFHPEKSHQNGMNVLKNFAKINA